MALTRNGFIKENKMKTCDICGMNASFETFVYLKPNSGRTMSLCGRCYRMLDDEGKKALAEVTQKVIKKRAAEVNKNNRGPYLIDSIKI